MIPGLNFVAIDFETATGKRDSACAVGWVEVEDGIIAYKGYRLIRPHVMDFNPMAVRIHGIRPEHVINEPTFDVIWNDLGPRLQGKKIIAHNAASFEIHVLRASLELYGIPEPEFDFGCTMQAALSLGIPAALNEVCQHFSIELNHHNALSDAEACAKIAISLYERFESFSIFNKSYSYHRRSEDRSGAINQKKEYFRLKFSGSAELEGLPWFDTEQVNSYDFQGKTVIITGVFSQYPNREDLAKLLVGKGAKIGSGISGKTNVVVVGREAGPSKINKVKSLIEKGAKFDLFNEDCIHQLSS